MANLSLSVLFSVLPQGPPDGQLAVAVAFTSTSITHLELTSVRGIRCGGHGLCALFQGGLGPLHSQINGATPLTPTPKKKKPVGILLINLGKTDILKIL